MRDLSQERALSSIPQAVTRALQEGSVAALATLVEGVRGVGAKVLIEETGALVAGGLGDASLDGAVALQAQKFLASRAEAATFRVEEFAPDMLEWRTSRILFERIEPEPRLVVCGAGHVGAALARLAHGIGYRTTLIDDRAEFLSRERFPETEIELVFAREGWAQAVREHAGRGRGVYVSIVTRGHNEDEECMRAAILARPRYLGLIGSKRRTAIVLERLRETGIEEAVLREVRAPIGLDIGAVSPEEVALAILAEIVAERRGGTGKPLSAWRREERK